MQRRKFLNGVMAGAGAAALPAQILAKAAAQTLAKVVPFHYGWACVYAQMNNGVSVADIERVFNISAADASSRMDRMLTRGVIRPSGLDGRSHPTRAWEPWDDKSATTKHKRSIEMDSQSKTGTQARQRFQRMIANMKADDHDAQAA